VVHYELLCRHLEGELRGLAGYLNVPLDEDRLECLLKDPMGSWKRPKKAKKVTELALEESFT